MNKRLAVVFHRLGPYHHARLESLARKCDVVAIELSRIDSEYAWDLEREGRTYPIVTLFEDRDITDIPGIEIQQRQFAALERLAPDVVAVPGWSASGALASLLWCGLSGTPAVLMSASTEHDEPRHWWREVVKSSVVRMAASALVGGTPHGRYITRLGIPAELVFPGYDVVDNAYFSTGADGVRTQAREVRARLGLPAQFFLASNRFVEKKNLPKLIEAYDRYRRRAGSDAWHLVLLGDGPLRTTVEEVIQERDLGDWVLLPGFKQYGDLPAYYGLAGAFVHASTSEQWGLVVNEAMAAGLPVLVSNCCGCAPDLVIEGENGYTFEPTDTLTLSDHMLAVASDACDREALGRRSREIIARWSPEAFSNAMLDAAAAALAAPRAGFGLHNQVLLWALMRR